MMKQFNYQSKFNVSHPSLPCIINKNDTIEILKISEEEIEFNFQNRELNPMNAKMTLSFKMFCHIFVPILNQPLKRTLTLVSSLDD